LSKSVLFLDEEECPYIDPIHDPNITPFKNNGYTAPCPNPSHDSGIDDTYF
jgi:hypothetical protein